MLLILLIRLCVPLRNMAVILLHTMVPSQNKHKLQSCCVTLVYPQRTLSRSEEHTSELQSQSNLVCRLLLEKKNKACANVVFGHRWILLRPLLPHPYDLVLPSYRAADDRHILSMYVSGVIVCADHAAPRDI